MSEPGPPFKCEARTAGTWSFANLAALLQARTHAKLEAKRIEDQLVIVVEYGPANAWGEEQATYDVVTWNQRKTSHASHGLVEVVDP